MPTKPRTRKRDAHRQQARMLTMVHKPPKLMPSAEEVAAQAEAAKSHPVQANCRSKVKIDAGILLPSKTPDQVGRCE